MPKPNPPKPQAKPSARQIAAAMRKVETDAISDAVFGGPRKRELTPQELRSARAGGTI